MTPKAKSKMPPGAVRSVAAKAKPDATKTKPNAAKAKPDATKTKPNAAKAKPDATKTKPNAAKAKPVATKAKVTTTTAGATKVPAKSGKAKAQPRPSDASLRTMFQRFHAKEPEPRGELEHVNAFTLLVAVVLSAQATDAGVNKATRALFKAADTPQKMLDLGEDQVREFIKTIGLFRNKAKNVIKLSEQLLADHAGVVPADRDALTALAGVGRKTANVVLSMAFGHKTMAVDTHVFRVAHRLNLSVGKTPEAVEDDLMAIIPDDYLFHAHHWLILHGRYTCLARGPKCGNCVIADLCTSADKRA
jgi:endonuclease III